MLGTNHRILIVEDERIVAADIKASLREMGYEVTGMAASAEEAIEAAAKAPPDLAMMDIRIRGRLDGVETAKILRENHRIPIVFLTANSDDATLERALQTEPEGFLLKPFSARSLRASIEVAMRKHAMQSELQRESTTDALTGLFNRRYLDAALEAEVGRSRRSEESFSVMLLDLDYFKRFNDTWGHAAGDSALRLVGELLRTNLRAYDLPCRYGGEEFAVILPKCTADHAVVVAERIRAGLRERAVAHDGKLLEHMTASIGIATFPQHRLGLDALMEACDAALYEAKRSGRDRIQIAK